MKTNGFSDGTKTELSTLGNSKLASESRNIFCGSMLGLTALPTSGPNTLQIINAKWANAEMDGMDEGKKTPSHFRPGP